MKVHIELIDNDDEEVVIIKCKNIDEHIQKIQQYITAHASPQMNIVFYKGSDEFYFPLETVLFFETSEDEVYAHTAEDAYRVKLRLYELEADLPSNFLRVSKSTILNVHHIYSIQRNLTASSKVQFRNSYKEVYVSRMYYKTLKFRLQGRSE
ncbi:DNA-binding LytR/AlgR family response regulator [Breznakia sp. PF5-3]|uniref:LytTR family DNA-binding domain-containing protein n=1 Tax=unclassified Breznakia TaxID=2623764 RepID=UPI00240534B0|nr:MULTISPECIES: LytTR family DNA-binding domain-containing protein [unclassified Breznakia]MDF9825762.1 DNA-binding LytR/AlgR family response regulator [Breznakia sp. PM6-1]MDF9835432.1 DNA-binding LytR/AlgR family response regulator [Breznakia sp. PF5-3]MDF9837664.1 DNA-binding LytR/AlgR family response regulator [Breznakia sp. PFB2-8]MDF9859528.1 DNA-binding LytR/AlgR family response regulator [Breznakia sp. PH5-24]